MRRYRYFYTSVLAFLLTVGMSACDTRSGGPQQATRATVLSTPNISAPLRPADMPQASTPSAASNTPQPTQLQFNTTDDIFAFNKVAAKESGGIRIEIARIVIGRKEIMEREGHKFADISQLNDVDVVGELIFKVTNISDKEVSVYLDQGVVVINNEQIDLQIGDDTSGSLLPGATTISGFRFGITRAKMSEITTMLVRVKAPVDGNNNVLGEDFEFTIDLSQREYQRRAIDINK